MTSVTETGRSGFLTARPRAVLLACLVIVVSVAIAHGRAVGFGFLTLDDGDYAQNARVAEGLTLSGIRWAFGFQDRTYYHPLTWLSLMANQTLLGGGAWGFHLVNVALHATTAILLMLAFAASTKRLGASLAAALLFAVHPLTVESVTWVTERKTVLSAALAAGAILAYAWHARAPSALRLSAVAALQALSLLAKPSTMVLPALLLAMDFWPLRRLRREDSEGEFPRASVRAALLEKLPLIAVSVATVALALASASHLPTFLPPLGTRVANAVVSVPRYLGSAFWPERLTVFHVFPPVVPLAQVVAALAIVAICTAIALATVKRVPAVLVGWAWLLVGLAPHLGILQTGLWPAWADRFVYVSLFGLSVAVVFGGAEIASRLGASALSRWIAVAAAACLLAAATWVQVGTWSTSETLFSRGVALQPQDPMLRHSLAVVYTGQRRYADAERELAEAVRLAPYFSRAWGDLGVARTRLGRFGEAEFCYRRALAIDAGDAEALYSLADLLHALGRADEARPFFRRFAARADPRFPAERLRAMQLAGH